MPSNQFGGEAYGVTPFVPERIKRYPSLKVAEQPGGYQLQARVRGYGPDEVEAAFAVGLAKLSPRGIDPNRVEAYAEDGMLTLRVPVRSAD